MAKRDDKDSTPVPSEWANFSDSDDNRDVKARLTKVDDWTHFSESEISASEMSSAPDPCKSNEVWEMTEEQVLYYIDQFKSLQTNLNGLIPGIQAKNFFEMSNLPREDLCKVWELSDIDCDGNLNLAEFCIAMHLVVLKKNTIPIPNELPAYLVNIAHSVELKTMTEFASNDNLPPKEEIVLQSNIVAGKLTESTDISMTAPNYPSPVQVRAPSLSSQSDISNISDGVLAFDSRLPVGAIITHPVAVRPLSGALFAESDTVPLNLFSDDMSTMYDTINSTQSLQSPPTPPPRNTVKDAADVPSSNEYLYGEPFESEPAENNELDAVKRRCDELVKENMSLSKRLMNLQEKRIYLEIVMENGMPLSGM